MAATTLAFNTSFSACDDAWGPQVSPACRAGDGLDFSLLFEESILSLGPVSLLLLAAPLRIFQLYRQGKKVVPAKIHDLKLWNIFFYGVLQIVILGVWAAPWTDRTRLSLANAVFSFLGTFALAALSHIEHVRSISPSLILNTFLFVSLLFDIARARTLWLIPGNFVLSALFSTAVLLKAMIVALEAKEKRKILLDAYHALSPESTSGVYSQSLFWWLNPLFLQGSRGLLRVEDLYPLDEKLESRYNMSKLEKSWQSVNQEKKHALVLATMKTYRWQLFTTTLWRFAEMGCTLAQPFLINSAVSIVSEPATELSKEVGYALIGGTVLLFFAKAIATAQASHRLYRNLTMLRGGLVTLVYKKTVDVHLTAVKESAALTLMSADVEMITVMLGSMHSLYIGIIQASIATYLLQRQVGYACFAPIVFSVGSMALTVFIGKFIGPRQQRWLEVTQNRVNVISSLLDSMKGVKALGLINQLSQYIASLRGKEIERSMDYRKLTVANIGNRNLPFFFGPPATFAVFVILAASGNGGFGAAKAFTSLSLIVLLTEPLGILMYAYPQLKAAISSFDRIQTFLLAESRKDFRIQDLETPASVAPVARTFQSRSMIDEIELVPLRPYGSHAGNRSVIDVVDGSFGWKKDVDLLHNINLSIRQGTLTFIVGPVGSGKSTLLKALLGETTSSKGFVHVSSLESGFCDQTPWIINGTIQENVLGENSFDLQWYNKVVSACALANDIRQMKDGDQTMVGSQGITLSGGQKQRISIARAVYARKAVAIFDDVFSGLDPPTEKQIFHEVFGAQGLLRQSRTTVLLATHAFRWLPFADHIVALDASGRIQEDGLYDSLITKKGYVYNLSLRRQAEHDEVATVAPASNSTLGARRGAAMAEDFSRKTGDFSIYKFWFNSFGPWACVLFLVYLVVFTVGERFPVIWLKWWAEANTRHPNQKSGYYLGMYFAFSVIGLVGLTLAAWQSLCRMSPRSSRRLHKLLLNTTLNAPMSFFAATDTGITTNRFSQDIQLVDVTLPTTLINFAATAGSAVASIVLTAVSASFVGIALPVAAIFLYVLQKFYLMTSRQLRFLDLEAKSPLYSHFLESLNGAATLRAFGWQAASQAKNIELLDMGQRPYYLLFCVQRWLNLVLDLFVGTLAVLTIAVAVSVRGNIGGGNLGVALLSIIDLSIVLSMVIQLWTQLETSIGAISRIKNFTIETENENLPGETAEPAVEWPSKASISFSQVAASYTGSATNTILRDISLDIRPGETVAICGRSGSGKSSLVSALFRMLELTAGAISIDGMDISTMPRNTVRSRLIALPQDPFFLSGTIRYNSDLTLDHTDAEILEMFEKVGLAPTIEGLGGLDADLDPKQLSHGQRQLFCLVRALLKRIPTGEGSYHPSILVLDEATSAVDAETDDLMQRVIREEFVNFGFTVIAIAHRLDTVMDFDTVVVLDKGEIVEKGNPGVLMEVENSRFRRLYESKGQETSSAGKRRDPLGQLL